MIVPIIIMIRKGLLPVSTEARLSIRSVEACEPTLMLLRPLTIRKYADFCSFVVWMRVPRGVPTSIFIKTFGYLVLAPMRAEEEE